MKNYKLTEETITLNNGVILHRIKCIYPISNLGIEVGDKGGYIESESNLDGNAWVGDDACVFGNACVSGNAHVFGKASVFGNAHVFGKACVSGHACVRGDALVSDKACVYGNAHVSDNAHVFGKACVYDDAYVCGNAHVSDNACVFGNALVSDNACVCDDACVGENIDVFGDAKIQSIRDYIVFKNWWSSGSLFVWTRSNNMWSAGGFCGTGEQLIENAYKDSEESGREYKRVVDYVQSILDGEKVK